MTKKIVHFISSSAKITFHYLIYSSMQFGKFTYKVLLLTFSFVIFSLITTLIGLNKVNAAPLADFQTSPIISTGLNSPTGLQFSPDGRLFILERAGKVKIYKNGQLLPNIFVDLNSVSSGDRGLIGIAFDPDYSANHYVYFYFTSSIDNHNRIVRYDASSDVSSGAGTTIYTTNYNSDGLHVGGGMAFGPDGKIYLGVGDNGSPINAQDYSTQQGKILRINKDGSIPQDNPFIGQQGKLPEIWAAGLRNPWRLKFDALGNLFVGDVGGSSWEEINKIVKGANYGWPTCEGMCNNTNFSNPLYTYSHNGNGAAITYGLSYTGSMFPSSFKNKLFFGDYVQGFIKTITLDSNNNYQNIQDFDNSAGSVVDMQQAGDGSIYYVNYYPGQIYKISYNPVNKLPIATASADKTKGISPLTINFSSLGSTDPNGLPLSYQWNFGDGTTSSELNPSKTYVRDGIYTAQLTVNNGLQSSTSLPLVIQVGTPPTVTIFSPLDGSTYKAGDNILCNVFGTDGNGTDSNDNNISTDIILHHNTHIHPFLGPIKGKICNFTVPTVGESDADTWYELKTTITDSIGLSTTKSVSIYPIKTNFTLNTEPAGLQILLEGSPVTTPKTIQGVVGYVRDLNVNSIQQLNGKYYQFDHWSDNGLQHHTFITSSDSVSYTAIFKEAPDFTGSFYNNMTLTGDPILIKSTSDINYDWGNGSPDPLIQPDHFSARWIKSQNFTVGKYTFTVTADDGVRLYIDNNLVLDKWINQPATTYNLDVNLTEGLHQITLEYFENTGNAVAKLAYVNSTGVSGNPVFASSGTVTGTNTNQPAMILVNVTNSGGDTTNILVDTEIYNSQGVQVFQKIYFGQNFSSAQQIQFNTNFITANNGTYTLKVGVFNSNWSKLYNWNDTVTIFNLSSSTNSAPIFTSTAITKDTTINKPSTITTNIKNAGGSISNIIIDIEIYDTSNNQIFQKIFTNQNFDANQTISFDSISNFAISGKYTIKIGIFSSNWSTLYNWNDSAAIINIT